MSSEQRGDSLRRAPERGSAPARYFNSVDACREAIVDRIGDAILLGVPLGIGKATRIADSLFDWAARDTHRSLKIFTALTLEIPSGSSELEKRFVSSFAERLYAGCSEPRYAIARRNNALPGNIEVSEFFLQTGAFLGHPSAQQHYVSSNYTHVARDLVDRGVNVIAQMVAPHPTDPTRVSLSCNPDVTLDILAQIDADRRKELVLIAEINPQLPYMPHDADVSVDLFDFVVDDGTQQRLFPVPSGLTSYADYAIGLHVAGLMKDGGTLQIGIGAIGEAIVHALCLRQQDNDLYRVLLQSLAPAENCDYRANLPLEKNRFKRGLYAASEMFVEGFLQLRDAGVLTRQVYDDEGLQTTLNATGIERAVTPELLQQLFLRKRISSPLSQADVDFLQHFGILRPDVSWEDDHLRLSCGELVATNLNDTSTLARLEEGALGQHLRHGIYLHGGFFLGTHRFYDQLRALGNEERDGICMTGINFINSMVHQTALKVSQRQHARFINSAMMATLTGAVISDGLEDARVVSGVGGQHDFVVQGRELRGARSVIVLPSTRMKGAKRQSNIVWQYPHTTIPRHLRDVVVTEYGAVDLRGKSDRDVIVALLTISDSEFQTELLEKAKAAGKVEADYRVPAAFGDNTPQRLERILGDPDRVERFPYFALSTDFSPQEALTAAALDHLKGQTGNRLAILPLLVKGFLQRRSLRERHGAVLKVMALDIPQTFAETVYQSLLLAALSDGVDPARPLINGPSQGFVK